MSVIKAYKNALKLQLVLQQNNDTLLLLFACVKKKPIKYAQNSGKNLQITVCDERIK